jgi:hypothetical protein
MGEDGVQNLILVVEDRHLDEDGLDATIDKESSGDVQRLSRRKLPHPKVWGVDVERKKPVGTFTIAVRE